MPCARAPRGGCNCKYIGVPHMELKLCFGYCVNEMHMISKNKLHYYQGVGITTMTPKKNDQPFKNITPTYVIFPVTVNRHVTFKAI